MSSVAQGEHFQKEAYMRELALQTGAAVFEGCGSLYREQSCIRGSVGFRVFGHECRSNTCLK